MNWLVLILAVFLQNIVPVVNLPALVLAVVNSREESASRAYLMTFGTGLLADLALGERLGTMTTAYLLMTLVMFLFKSRFRFNNFSVIIFLVVTQVAFFYARALIG